MKKNNKVSPNQIRGLMVSTIVGIGILSLPNNVAVLVGNDGWITIILGGLLIIPVIIIINKIFEMYPNMSFFQIGELVLGKWIFNFLLILYLSYLIALMGFLTRNLGEIGKAFLLETTPIEVLIISFILVTTYIARSEIHIIARAAYHIYPIIIGLIIFLILVTLPSTDFTNMLPVFQSDIRQFPKSIMIGFFSYSGFEVLLFALPFVEDRKKGLWASLTGLGIVIIIYTITFVISLSQYGIKNLQRQTFPTLSIVKEIDLPGYFIENLDGLVTAIWILIVFASMAATYYFAGKILSNIFRTKDHSLFILPLLPFIYIISLIPQHMIQLGKELGGFIDYSGLILTVLMPITIYIVGYIRRRRDI